MIGKIECASCAATIENMLNKMGGVENVSLDFFKVTSNYDSNRVEIREIRENLIS
ncbi:cation transporter [Clostridium perfringens]|nr:heavy-metal-associated domain-containing protein [Clostridium perfringens]